MVPSLLGPSTKQVWMQPARSTASQVPKGPTVLEDLDGHPVRHRMGRRSEPGRASSDDTNARVTGDPFLMQERMHKIHRPHLLRRDRDRRFSVAEAAKNVDALETLSGGGGRLEEVAVLSFG